MNTCLLISLLSDQTIPNVQLINEFGESITNYLFISTLGMEKKGIRQWIIKSCNIETHKILEPIIVDQFSFDDIEQKLDAFLFEKYEKVIVNLTGGTKVMTLAAFVFFKDLGAEIYYLTGSDDTLIKLAPGRKKKIEKLKSQVNLLQYFNAYGFEVEETQQSSIPVAYTSKLFSLYLDGKFTDKQFILTELRKRRDKKTTEICCINGLKEFLEEIEFPKSLNNIMTKYDVKYLTGEWFEEYVANRITEELNLSGDYLKTGIVINKKNNSGISVPNEMDVVFTWKNKIYSIECKTSVFYESILPDGTKKNVSIIGETLYKNDSLKQGLGLFTNMSIFILDSIKDHHDRIKNHLDRAKLYGINIIDKDALINSGSIINLLGIKNN